MLWPRTILTIAVAIPLILASASFTPVTIAQNEPTLVGEWRVFSTPIDDEQVSRMGNTLGFPSRDMTFEQDGNLRTGFVAREDAGTNVKPLGVWRINGNSFSATFQLWCPNSSQPCGSIIMRGEFTREDRIRGTMTAFFDEKDPTRPTGYDTWVFSFRGERLAGGSN